MKESGRNQAHLVEFTWSPSLSLSCVAFGGRLLQTGNRRGTHQVFHSVLEKIFWIFSSALTWTPATKEEVGWRRHRPAPPSALERRREGASWWVRRFTVCGRVWPRTPLIVTLRLRSCQRQTSPDSLRVGSTVLTASVFTRPSD